MSWTDAVKDHANAVLRERDTAENRLFGNAQPVGWDPYEVWLTRVKRPRECAAESARKDAA